MLIEARDLAVIRGDRLVLQGVALRVQDGDALVIGGPNGAGKTTLLRVLAGLIRADRGTVLWDGVSILDDPPRHAARVALLGHLDAIKPALSLAENLQFDASVAGRKAAEIATALDAMGLAGQSALPARLLSAGQRRRLALARVLLARATLLLLDEPATALDAASADRLAAALAAHRARGGAVIVSTHQALPLPGARHLSLGHAPEAPGATTGGSHE